jgi:hypothetical protein
VIRIADPPCETVVFSERIKPHAVTVPLALMPTDSVNREPFGSNSEVKARGCAAGSNLKKWLTGK